MAEAGVAAGDEMADSAGWSASDLPDLSGRNAVVSGANSGLGLEVARALAGRGAHVVLACRNLSKAEDAASRIRADQSGASLEIQELDLASLDSIRKAAETLCERYSALHLICNNAGVMALPRRTTADGFEMQIGTNHLGHFAWTGLLLDRLLAAPGARVVNVSSIMHRIGRMHFDDLHGERRYNRWLQYGRSKLANLLFTFELQRRLAGRGLDALAAAAHPGYASTNLQFEGARMDGSTGMERAFRGMNRVFSQTAEMGALPTLYAAAAVDVEGGDYFGPDGFMEMTGHPTRVGSSARSRDALVAQRLWEVSETLTGVRFEALR